MPLAGTLPRFGRCLIERRGAAPPAVAVALDEALSERVGRGVSPPTVRIWQNGPAVVVPRRRLARGATCVRDGDGREWPICGRASGGSAVAHGPGTLNLSLILPLDAGGGPSIVDAYRLWISVLDDALRSACGVSVEASEVDGAFCQGSYDAAVDGRKLAGTAQARRGGSVLVHGTILVDVDPVEYVALVAAAERLLGGAEGEPAFHPERVVSLHEAAARRVSTDELAAALGRAAGAALEWRAGAAPRELQRARELSAR